MRRPSLLRSAVLLAFALLAGACGGGDEQGEVAQDSTTTTPDEATTTTDGEDGEGSTPTTAGEDEEDDGEEDDGDVVAFPSTGADGEGAAAAGLLLLEDLGAGWVEHTAASGVADEVGTRSRIGCAFGPEGADPAAVTGLVDGAIFQRGEAAQFASSFALSHADESSAQATVEAYRSAAWSRCRVEKKTEEAVAADPTTSWRADPVVDEGRGQGGYEGVVRFRFQGEVDGEVVDGNGYESVLLYRVGNVVLVIAAEGVAGEADPPDLDQAVTDELYAATILALGRLGS